MRESFPPKPPIAVYPLTNWGGVEVLGVQNGVDDKVEVAINTGSTRKQRGPYKVYTTARGRTYFIMDSIRYYLDDFVRL